MMERIISYIDKLSGILNHLMLNVLMIFLFPLSCKNYIKYLIPYVQIEYQNNVEHLVRVNEIYSNKDKCYYSFN